MRTEQIHLEKITWDNYKHICKLRVTKEQDGFVARNERSLIHAYIALSQGEIRPYPFGIYLGKKPIGFVMIGYNGWEEGDPEFMKNTYFIWRFMIDKRYQGKGYGRQAFGLAVLRAGKRGRKEALRLLRLRGVPGGLQGGRGNARDPEAVTELKGESYG